LYECIVLDFRAQQSPLTRRAAALSLPSLQGCAFFTRDRLELTMSLQSYIDQKVLIITVDGRTLVGTLLSCDQVTNIVLNDTVERIIRPADDPEPSSEVSHGLYLVRGDNITIVGLVDQELDNSIDWEKVRGEVIGTTKHV
jgi:U6 snRNA-associated Sm-like protein LSm8